MRLFRPRALPLDSLFDQPWVKGPIHLMKPSPFHMGDLFGKRLKEAYKRRPLETPKERNKHKFKARLCWWNCSRITILTKSMIFYLALNRWGILEWSHALPPSSSLSSRSIREFKACPWGEWVYSHSLHSYAIKSVLQKLHPLGKLTILWLFVTLECFFHVFINLYL